MLILERPWTRQPPVAVGVDRGNPISKGLVALFVPTMGPGNIVGTSKLFLPTIKLPTTKGITGRFSGEVSSEASILTSDFSFVTAFICSNTGNATSSLIGRGPTSSSNNTGFGFNATHSNSSYSGAVYCGSSYSIIGKPTGGTLASNTLYVIGAGVSGSAGAVYSGGIKTASVSSGLSARDLTGRLTFGVNSQLSDSFLVAPDFLFYAQWNRWLLDVEFASISSNPWQLFAPLRIPIPTAAAAATVPTLSASTYVPGSLTSTGWRPQITAS